MNEIDIIIISNILGLLALLFFLYKWFRVLLKTYGKAVAFLLPLACLGFAGSLNTATGKDTARERNTQPVKEPVAIDIGNSGAKTVHFSQKISLLQELHFTYEMQPDRSNGYYIAKDPGMYDSGVSSNFKWTDHSTNLVKINDSIYVFDITATYKSNILGIVSFCGQKDFMKQINLKDY